MAFGRETEISKDFFTSEGRRVLFAGLCYGPTVSETDDIQGV